MIEKIPPHNAEAEKSVLGAALLSKDALADVIDVVKTEDFYDKAHREIFDVMLELFRNSKSVDMVTVCEELKKNKALDLVGGRSYVASLSAEVPSVVNAAEYAKIVAEKASMRKLIQTAEEIREKGYDESMEASEILDYAEKNIFEIAQSRQGNDYAPIKEVLMENVAMIDKAINSQGEVTGLTTGFKKLDEVTSGLQKSDLVIIAARPAMGKTAFVLNVAQNAAIKAGASVLIFSLEMAKAQLGQRLLSMESRVEMQKLKTGAIERNDWDRINMALDSLSRTNIHIDDNSGISILEMKNKCRRLKAEKGLDLIIVDYLQLMQSDGKSDSRQQEISALSRQLKLLAREMDCPVLVLSQLSRAPEQRQDHRPILSDLRESGSIEQDADIVIFLYRDDYYNDDSEKPGVCEVNLAKHRSGPTEVVDLTWVARYTKFSDQA
ncbi:MAG: replicative DNA helicase [Clostridia bacterium]|nr:replicative DNA helicase [Clostridia bacterium]MDO5303209.1 replicative DNA helicase [Clostridia bacterium]